MEPFLREPRQPRLEADHGAAHPRPALTGPDGVRRLGRATTQPLDSVAGADAQRRGCRTPRGRRCAASRAPWPSSTSSRSSGRSSPSPRSAPASASPRARRTGLLGALHHEEMIEFDPASRRYRLGLRVFRLGSVVSKTMELATRSDSLLEALAEKTGETAYVVVPDGDEAAVHQALRLAQRAARPVPRGRQASALQLRSGSPRAARPLAAAALGGGRERATCGR